MPSIGPLDDPSARFATAAGALRFTTMADMWPDPSSTDSSIYVRIVIPFVETEICGATWAT
jgi:hypothetical protein